VFFALHIWWPESRAAGIDLASVLISLVALVALMRFKVGVIPVIVACGLAGLALRTLL
jgi:chromate transporter